MIDLHLHILPGVDDGPSGLDESVQMCRLAGEGGCETLVATPHQRHDSWWNTDSALLGDLAGELQDRVGDRPKILLGGEISVDSGLLDDLEQMPESGLLPLAGSSYMLLEFSRYGLGPDPQEVVHETILAGWRPIVAHPEFVPALNGEPSPVGRLADLGAKVQVTAASLLGDFGKQAQRFALELLTADLVHFVASDAHGVRWRPPGLKRAYDEVVRRRDEATARRLFIDNPRAVIEDRPIEGSNTAAADPASGRG